MKRLVIALILLLMTAGICLGARLEADRTAARLETELEGIGEACQGGDPAAAALLADRFAAGFEKNTRLLPLFLPHALLESAAESAALLPILARADPAELQAELLRCRSRLEQIRQRERIDWQNLF